MYKCSTPVFVQPVFNGGVQSLKVWNGNVPLVIKSPTLPYLFSKEKGEHHDIASQEEVTVMPLSSRKLEAYHKIFFNSTSGYKDYLTLNGDKVVEACPDYVNLVAQNNLNFFKDYPTQSLRVLSFDIEQLTDGKRFPEPGAPLLSIAYKLNDDPIQCEMTDGKDDAQVVLNFANLLHSFDPDIIIGFNHCKYDIPVIMHKFTEYGIPNSIWGREDRDPFFYKKKVGPSELSCISVPGRIIYDVYHCALTDQTLNGEGRGLKNLARIFKKDLAPDVEVIEEEMHDNRHLIGTERLVKYNSSDVFWTEKLFGMYFKNNLAIASFVGAPLNKIVPLATTYGFMQILGNIFAQNGILADTSNTQRYPYAFENLQYYKDENGKRRKQKPYQGAIVQCNYTGLFQNVIDCDVASLYPSIMAALSCGSDNTRILRTEPLGPFRVTKLGNVRTYYLPDTMRKWTWVVQVIGESLVATKIKEFLAQRMEIKRQSKIKDDAALFSIAYALKIVLNSCYGLAGSKAIPYGELGVAVLTTICGRMIIQEGAKFVGEDNVILIDTDAVKMEASKFPGLVQINEHFKTWMPKTLHGEPLINWETDEYEAVWVLQMKNYLTLKKSKKGGLDFKKHGASFKGTRLTRMFNKIIDSVGYTLLTKGKEAATPLAVTAFNMKQYNDEDFVMRTRIGMELDEYDNQDSVQPEVARMAEERRGTPVFVGQTIQYVKVRNGYDLPSEEAFKNIDKDYYKGIITDALSRMGFEKMQERRLDAWL